MSYEGPGPGTDAEGLRERNVPLHTNSVEGAKATVLDLNSKEEHADKDEKDKKTFGRTPNGTGELLVRTTSLSAPIQTCPALRPQCTVPGHLESLRSFDCAHGNDSMLLGDHGKQTADGLS